MSKLNWPFAIGRSTTICTFGLPFHSSLTEQTTGVWNLPCSRMATTPQLPIHLPTLPPKKGYAQKTCDEHQRTVWTCHPLAKVRTQVHSNRLELWTIIHSLGPNTEARFEQTKMLRSTMGVSLCAIYYVDWQTTSRGPIALSPFKLSTLPSNGGKANEHPEPQRSVPHGPWVQKPSTHIETIPLKVALTSFGIPSPVSHTVFQDGIHQACLCA